MWPVTDAFKAKLYGDHTPAFKLEILSHGLVVKVIQNTQDEETVEEGIIGGHVALDASAKISAQGAVSIANRDGSLIPLIPSDYLAPFGHELRVYRGILIDGETEFVPLVTGPMESVNLDDQGDGVSIDVDVWDRMKSLESYSWTTEYEIAEGTNLGTAILAILVSRFPPQIYAQMIPQFVATTVTTPHLVLGVGANGDPAQDCIDIAKIGGLVFTWDRMGNPVLKDEPDPDTQDPVVTIEEGSNLLTISKSITSKDGANGVIVTGGDASNGGPYYGSAWDTDSTSDFYYLGDYGPRPKKITDTSISSTSAAQSRANAEMLRISGKSEQVGFGTIVNPALDPGDVVQLTRTGLGVDARYVIQALPIPLDVVTPMSCSTRVRSG